MLRAGRALHSTVRPSLLRMPSHVVEIICWMLSMWFLVNDWGYGETTLAM